MPRRPRAALAAALASDAAVDEAAGQPLGAVVLDDLDLVRAPADEQMALCHGLIDETTEDILDDGDPQGVGLGRRCEVGIEHDLLAAGVPSGPGRSTPSRTGALPVQPSKSR